MYQCTIEQHRAAEAGGQGITNFRSSMDYGDGGKTRSELHKIYKLCELCELFVVAHEASLCRHVPLEIRRHGTLFCFSLSPLTQRQNSHIRLLSSVLMSSIKATESSSHNSRNSTHATCNLQGHVNIITLKYYSTQSCAMLCEIAIRVQLRSHVSCETCLTS